MTWQPIIETCGPLVAAIVLVAAIFAAALRAIDHSPAAPAGRVAGEGGKLPSGHIKHFSSFEHEREVA